jgi:drug/metabolite transporter superfamily protein YnfA
MRFLDQLVARPGGIYFLLFLAALLEVLGDAYFQSAIHHSYGVSRWAYSIAGVVVLSLYGLFVNLPSWNFGRLLGVYAFFFYVIAQILARIRFKEPITLPTVIGGLLFAAGCAVITFWKA